MKSSGRTAPAFRHVIIAVLVVLLCVKYLWSLSVSPVPFGYDAGIYRFLFLRHAEGWPPFLTAALPEWAKGHPLGLFAFTSPLLQLGVPVSALIGWVWNLFPVLLACVLSWAVSRKNGERVGIAVLVVALLSVAQYEGFIAMYWKVFAALLWCALAFHFLERRSPWWILFGMLVIATHLQVGLVMGLSILSACALRFLSGDRREGVFLLWTGAAAAVLGAAWYLPNYGQAIAPVVANMLRSVNAAGVAAGLIVVAAFIVGVCVFGRRKKARSLNSGKAFLLLMTCIIVVVLAAGTVTEQMMGSTRFDTESGSFLSLLLYFQLSLPLVLFGVIGFYLSLRGGEYGSVWQWALTWCAALVFSQFFFYLRFLLLLDFFLLPFAAIALERLWSNRDSTVRWLVAALLCVQCVFTLQRIGGLQQAFSSADLRAIAALSDIVQPGDTLIVADNVIAPWVLGMLPAAEVAAPGVFVSLPYDAWKRFVYGTEAERTAFLNAFPSPAFLYISGVFDAYYPKEVTRRVIGSPCLAPTAAPGLYRVACPGR